MRVQAEFRAYVSPLFDVMARAKLLLQSFLFVLSSFLFSFLLSHWFLLGGSSAQCNHCAQAVRIANQVFACVPANARASSSLLIFLTFARANRLFILFKYLSLLACFFLAGFKQIFLPSIK
jgi:hypothetical protein